MVSTAMWGEGTLPNQNLTFRGKALSVLPRVLAESCTASNLELDGEHTHPSLGCWSIFHSSVSLTQQKPLGTVGILLQVSPIREDPYDASYLHWAGVCQAVVSGYEWVSAGPCGKVWGLPGPLLFPDP